MNILDSLDLKIEKNKIYYNQNIKVIYIFIKDLIYPNLSHREFIDFLIKNQLNETAVQYLNEHINQLKIDIITKVFDDDLVSSESSSYNPIKTIKKQLLSTVEKLTQSPLSVIQKGDIHILAANNLQITLFNEDKKEIQECKVAFIRKIIITLESGRIFKADTNTILPFAIRFMNSLNLLDLTDKKTKLHYERTINDVYLYIKDLLYSTKLNREVIDILNNTGLNSIAVDYLNKHIEELKFDTSDNIDVQQYSTTGKSLYTSVNNLQGGNQYSTYYILKQG